MPMWTKYIVASVIVLAVLGVGLFALGGGFASGPEKETLTVYVAAGIMPPVEQAARRYEREEGVKVRLESGNSGHLLGQIKLHGRGDLYIPADDSFVERGRKEGLLAESLPLAKMRLVLGVNPERAGDIRTLDDLLKPGVKYGLAAPDAGAGKETAKALERAGVWDRVRTGAKTIKLTVTDVAEDAKMGTLDAAFVWDATARQRGLTVVELPELEGTAVTVPAAVLSVSKHPDAALRFARYLAAPDRGGSAFRDNQYEVVGGDTWAVRPRIVLFAGTVNRPAIRDTLAAFQKREGVDIVTVYQGCGSLQGQMRTGSIPDAYLACDISYEPPVDGMSPRPAVVSEMDLVIVTKPGNPKNIRTLADLARLGIKVEVSDAKVTSMGGVTQRLLAEAGLEDRIDKVVIAAPGDVLVGHVRTINGLDAAIAYATNAMEAVRDNQVSVVPIDHPDAKAVQAFWRNERADYPQLVGRLLTALKTAESESRYKAAGFRPLWGEAGSRQ